MANNRCDAGCRRPALTWWTRDTDDTDTAPDLDGWQMCSHCSNRHAAALDAKGYELWVDERDTVSSQGPRPRELKPST